MAYVAPQTEVLILKDIPLDRTYTNTLTFATEAAQQSYFRSKAVKDLTACTYQRVYPEPTGVFRSDYNRQHAINCNYLMFRNTGQEGAGTTKWFYAFITDIEYMNNSMANIHFELDVMQSYMFDYNLKECWVEREHPNSDNIGANTLPEPVDVGPYVVQGQQTTDNFQEYSVMIGYIQAEGSGSVSATYMNGIFSGVFYQVFPCNTYDQAVSIGSFLAGFTATGDNENIVSINFVPTAYISTDVSTKTISYTAPARPTGIGAGGGYTPRNRKLLTFPYVLLKITNGDGDEQLLHYEFFSDPQIPIMWTAAYVGTLPEVICIPRNYAGEHLSFDNKIGISDFPQCAYATDAFKAYQAMNAGARQLGFAQRVASGVTTGGIAGGITSIAGGVFQASVDDAKAATMTDRPKGNQTGNALIATRQLDFYFQSVTIRAEYARVIDDFFDRYGYNTQRLKVPNVTGRPQWNYVKTRDCTITGNGGIPTGDAERICSIYNAGITFWHNPSNVGNYSLNNAPS